MAYAVTAIWLMPFCPDQSVVMSETSSKLFSDQEIEPG